MWQQYFGCVIIVRIKFVDQDIIEFLYCFLYIRQPVEFFNVMYIYIYIYIYIYTSKSMNETAKRKFKDTLIQ